MTKDRLTKLLISIGISFLPGIIGGFATANAVDTWYATIEKPFFSPPNFIFGPVWTTLYLLMGVSLYLVWTAKTKDNEGKRKVIILFLMQLFLNGLWSFLFFGFKNPELAAIGIVILWLSIWATIFRFSKYSRVASLILIPYVLWVSFAMILNFAIALLN